MNLNCAVHKFPYQMICLTQNCLQILCQECLKTHNQVHSNQQMQVENFGNMFQYCRQMMEQHRDQLQSEIDKLDDKSFLEAAKVERIKQLRSMCRSLKKVLKSFFLELERHYSDALQTSLSNVNSETRFYDIKYALHQKLTESKDLLKLLEKNQKVQEIIRFTILNKDNMKQEIQMHQETVQKSLQEVIPDDILLIDDEIESKLSQLMAQSIMLNNGMQSIQQDPFLHDIVNNSHQQQQQQQYDILNKAEGGLSQSQLQTPIHQPIEKTASNESNSILQSQVVQSQMKVDPLALQSGCNQQQLQHQLQPSLTQQQSYSVSSNSKAGQQSISSRNSQYTSQKRSVSPIRPTATNPPTLQKNPQNNSKLIDHFQINMPSYFKCSVNNFLHYFKANYFYKFDLSNPKPAWKKQKIAGQFTAPLGHRSLALPTGEIFLLGGSNTKKEVETHCYLFNQFTNKLEIAPFSLNLPRTDFGCCFCDKFLYVLGGWNEVQGMLRECEVLDLSQQDGNKKFVKIASLMQPACSMTVCAFQDYFVFKLGGMDLSKSLNYHIERYNPETNVWGQYSLPETIDVNFGLLPLAGSVQVNSNFILIFGGKDQKKYDSDQTFILEVGEDFCRVSGLNVIQLPKGLSFEHSNIFVQDNKICCVGSRLSKGITETKRKVNVVTFSNSMEWELF